MTELRELYVFPRKHRHGQYVYLEVNIFGGSAEILEYPQTKVLLVIKSITIESLEKKLDATFVGIIPTKKDGKPIPSFLKNNIQL